MKHLLSGIAVAAVLALALPAGAQSQNTASTSSAPAPTQMAPTQTPTNHKAVHARKMSRHVKRTAMHRHRARSFAANTRGSMHRRSMSPSDNMANALNRQEAQRLSGSSMPSNGASM